MNKGIFFAFISYVALAFFAYRDCFTIFIPGDNYSLLYMFENNGAAASIMTDAQKNAPYFVALPLLYFLYQLFGILPSCWMMIAITFHVLNSFLVLLIAKLLMKTFFPDRGIMVAFFPALLFLISPYQTEEVLWTAINIRWLLHACVTLAGIYIFINYLVNPSSKKIIAIHFLFLLGLFSYEFTLICPLIYTVLFLLFRKLGASQLHPKKFFMQMILPQIFFISTYFLACKLLSGHWFWHAGTFEDIIQTSDYPKTFLKYFAKFFLFYRYLSIGQMDNLLRTLSANHWTTALSCFFVLAAIAIFFWKLIITKKEFGYFLSAVFACFIISLLPVLPLDSSFLSYIYPDRYGYLPSVFFYLFLTSSFFFLFKKIAAPVMVGYAILCWILLMKTIPVWNSANDYCNQLIQNYKPFLKYDKVYVLNVPTYYKGVAAFRSAFEASIFFKQDKYPVERINVISGCYQDFPADSLLSVRINGKLVEVKSISQKSPYFSTNGGWAKSYETEEYKVTFDSTGCSYSLLFKQEIPENSAFIYTSNGSWKKAE
ncbi:MAG: hypothetical protein AABZ32_02225 [Bacteroidota bacterium]